MRGPSVEEVVVRSLRAMVGEGGVVAAARLRPVVGWTRIEPTVPGRPTGDRQNAFPAPLG